MLAAELRNIIMPAISGLADEKTKRFMRYFTGLSRDDSACGYIKAIMSRGDIAGRWDNLLRKYQVVVGPCYIGQVPDVDFDIADMDSFCSFMKSCSIIFMASLLGLPAVTVPVGEMEGMPMAVQVISGRFRDDLCLDVAEDMQFFAGTMTPVDPVTGASR
jgi:amidase